MAVSTVCTALRRLTIGRQYNIVARSVSTHLSGTQTSIPPSAFYKSENGSIGTTPEIHIKFAPRTLNIDIGIPPSTGIIKSIIERPFVPTTSMEDPTKKNPIGKDPSLVDKTIEMPTIDNIIEKQAIRLLVIRYKKMKKHKRLKLRRKMRVVWLRIRQLRNVVKEKAIQNALMAKIASADAFDAKKYVASKLEILNKEFIPRTFRGEILPPSTIKEFRAKKTAEREKRRNKPRLTL